MTMLKEGARVNFLIAGVQKGGTTALAKFLSLHEDVCMPPSKELHFFDLEDRYWGPAGNPDYNWYHSAFHNYNGQPAVGEATPIYVYWRDCLERIRAYNPDMKLIVSLRDPVDRAFSQYKMELARGHEHRGFLAALLLERNRLSRPQDTESGKCSKRSHSYADRGFYSKQMEHVYGLFPREQVLVLLSEELASDHAGTLARIYDFLGIRQTAPPPAEIVFASTDLRRPPLIARQYLRLRYRTDIRRLESVLGRRTGWI